MNHKFFLGQLFGFNNPCASCRSTSLLEKKKQKKESKTAKNTLSETLKRTFSHLFFSFTQPNPTVSKQFPQISIKPSKSIFYGFSEESNYNFLSSSIFIAEHVREFTCGKLYYRTFHLDDERDTLFVGAMWVFTFFRV